jgi:hypothetical protein
MSAKLEQFSAEITALIASRRKGILLLAEMYVSAIDFEPSIRSQLLMSNRGRLTPDTWDFLERVGRGHEPTAREIVDFGGVLAIEGLQATAN